MHATQKPAVEPNTEPNTHPGGAPAARSRRWDGQPETDADRRFFDLRGAGYTGWIDQDGYPANPPAATDGGTDAGTDAATVVDPDSPAVTLLETGRYLFEHGWIQGAYYDATNGRASSPKACLVGAIGMVCYGRPVDCPAMQFGQPGFPRFEAAVAYLDGYLADKVGDEHYTAYEFNDTRGRTVAEILTTLVAAANAYQAQRRFAAGKPATVAHADYPHQPGTLYDCPACESICYCHTGSATGLTECVYCAGEFERAEERWISQREAAREEALDALERDGYGDGGAW